MSEPFIEPELLHGTKLSECLVSTPSSGFYKGEETTPILSLHAVTTIRFKDGRLVPDQTFEIRNSRAEPGMQLEMIAWDINEALARYNQLMERK